MITPDDIRNKLNTVFTSIKESETRSSVDVEGLWKLTPDSTGNSSAVIRFLPSPHDDAPFIKRIQYAFRGPGGFLMENSPATIGLPCPITEYNKAQWNKPGSTEADRQAVRNRARRIFYYANIYVVSSPMSPDTEGGVYLFRFGKKIFDKIKQKIEPEFKGDDPVNVFDPWAGADFRIRMRMVDRYPNFDLSEWSPGPLRLAGSKKPATDEEIMELISKCRPLKPLIAPEQFKSYSALKARLEQVLHPPATPATTAAGDAAVADDSPPWEERHVQVTSTKNIVHEDFDDDDDEDMKHFRSLIERD